MVWDFIKILGCVKLHIGDLWGKMKTFALGHFHGETQTLGGLVIGGFTLGCVFGELQPFFPFSVMADTNFPLPSTLGKLETQTLGGVSNWKFCSRTRFWGATVIFPIFYNGQHQFSISVDTQKTVDPNIRGVGNWKFCSRKCFWGATAIFPIFCNGWHQFCISVNTRKSFALGRVFGELRLLFPFSIMADTNFPFPLTLGKPETQTLGGQ